MIIDAFMYNDEADMLECRLTEIGDVVDLIIAVEADVDHQNHPKPYHLTEALTGDRFDRWSDRLHVVRAADLPAGPDPWSREHAQREWIGRALDELAVPSDAVVLQSDVDEIPRAFHVRNVRPSGGLVVFQQRFHPFAVDWFHPLPWQGTVAGTPRSIGRLGDMPFTLMRDARLWGKIQPGFVDAGWHFTWVGQDPMKKVAQFCHPEVYDEIVDDPDRYLEQGYHVDRHKLEPVDVDEGWPKWIVQGHAPKSWFRPR